MPLSYGGAHAFDVSGQTCGMGTRGKHPMVEHLSTTNAVDILIILPPFRSTIKQRLNNILLRVVDDLIRTHSAYELFIPPAANSYHMAVIQLLCHCFDISLDL